MDYLYKQHPLEGSLKDLYEQDRDQFLHVQLTIVTHNCEHIC